MQSIKVKNILADKFFKKNDEVLVLPDEKTKLLFHICCAPCSGGIIKSLKESGIDFTIFYYNPNIQPKAEYEIRKEESKAYASKLGVPFVDGDYNYKDFLKSVKGYENEPERGARCTICFDMRLACAAKYAKENGFDIYTSSLGISRWKDLNQVNDCGIRMGEQEGVPFWDYNWRKKGGCQKMLDVNKEEHFYKQEYCGCVYSLRDSNKWREENGREKIKIAKKENTY